jgi:actin-related protein
MYFGKELLQLMETKKYNIEFSYPIENSRILERSIEEMVFLWGYAIGELMGVDLSKASLLVIDSVTNSKEYKAALTGVLFAQLKVDSVLFMNSSVLSLFSIGETMYPIPYSEG